MRRCLAVIFILVICTSATITKGADDWVGKKVMVNKWSAKLAESGKDVNTYIELGDIFTVTKVNGNWLWVGRGWIHNSDMVPLDQAIAYFTTLIRNEPNESNNYNNRAWAYKKMGNLEKAISDEGTAIRLKPSSAYYLNRGSMWKDKAEYDIAIADYNEAIRFDAKNVAAYNNRGLAWYEKGNYDKAISDFNEAIRIDPKASFPYVNRAWIWATCSNENYIDADKAIGSATKACELQDWRDGETLDTLATAYARKGDFDSAIKWEEKAMRIGIPSESDKTPEDLKARLELYKSGKPYREELKGK